MNTRFIKENAAGAKKIYQRPEIRYSGAARMRKPVAASYQQTPELTDENMEWDS